MVKSSDRDFGEIGAYSCSGTTQTPVSKLKKSKVVIRLSFGFRSLGGRMSKGGGDGAQYVQYRKHTN